MLNKKKGDKMYKLLYHDVLGNRNAHCIFLKTKRGFIKGVKNFVREITPYNNEIVQVIDVNSGLKSASKRTLANQILKEVSNG